MINATIDGGINQYPGSVLEGSSGKEGIGPDRDLGDTK